MRATSEPPTRQRSAAGRRDGFLPATVAILRRRRLLGLLRVGGRRPAPAALAGLESRQAARALPDADDRRGSAGRGRAGLRLPALARPPPAPLPHRAAP